MKIILLIGAGGFIGSVSRYLVTRWIQTGLQVFFPVGTLAVNVIGSFLIGLVFGLSAGETLVTPEWRLFLTVGILGGFTTFSSFSYDSLMLLRDGQVAAFLLYAFLSILLALVAVYLGYVLTKLL
ncbi:MAG TPA: fluoride efflux transporter CrcB [Bacteroidetes bacterium]|nr:fluoride efflux transporter CrcB [Bacteroidota bacterium]